MSRRRNNIRAKARAREQRLTRREARRAARDLSKLLRLSYRNRANGAR
jgi:hypothetical protein